MASCAGVLLSTHGNLIKVPLMNIHLSESFYIIQRNQKPDRFARNIAILSIHKVHSLPM